MPIAVPRLVPGAIVLTSPAAGATSASGFSDSPVVATAGDDVVALAMVVSIMLGKVTSASSTVDAGMDRLAREVETIRDVDMGNSELACEVTVRICDLVEEFEGNDFEETADADEADETDNSDADEVDSDALETADPDDADEMDEAAEDAGVVEVFGHLVGIKVTGVILVGCTTILTDVKSRFVLRVAEESAPGRNVVDSSTMACTNVMIMGSRLSKLSNSSAITFLWSLSSPLSVTFFSSTPASTSFRESNHLATRSCQVIDRIMNR